MTEETVISRIRSLTEAVRKASEGDFSFCNKTSGKNDELGLLADEIRRMAESVQDHIVGRKAAEDALGDCEEKYRRLKANIPGLVYMFAMHPDGTFSFPYVNEASRELFDISPEEIMADASLLTRLIHPDDRERFVSSIKRSAETLEPWREVVRLIVNGEVRWYDCISRPELQPNGDILWDGINLEITERKRVEEDLLLTKFCVDNAGIGIYHTSEQHIYNANDFACKSLGYTVEELRALSVFDIDPVVTMEKINQIGRILEMRGTATHQTTHRRKDGKTFPVEITTNMVEFQGKHYGISFVKDITERIQAEETLRFTQYAVDNAFAQAFWVKPDGSIFYVNNAACRSLGYSREELLGMTIPDIDPTFPPEVFAPYWRELKEKGYMTLETWQRTKDGRVYPVEVSSNYVVFDGNEYNCAFVTDITDRKRAEDALRESEEKFRVLAETSPTAIILIQEEDIVYVNKAFVQMTGYGEQELLRRGFWEFVHDEYREIVRERSLSRQRGEPVPQRYEIKIVTREGEERWVVISGGTMEYQGKPAGIVTLLDFTEAKQAQEQINASLAEKEILLKEVHHRVKNNMQIISTLLDLQSESFQDQRSLNAFRESQDRIRAMSLVHEELYQSRDLASIDYAEYIDKLAFFLFNSYLADPERITLTADVGHLPLDLDSAIPCGLIINELVSNALKHAFPDGRKGEITIRLRCGDDGVVRLTIADNGIGLPPGLDFRNTETLGLQLVNMLTKQLRGQIELSGDQGTSWEITFSPMDNGKSA